MKYRLTALTPLLVGDGRELSPIDYMVWRDQVNVLDQKKIFNSLRKSPLLDRYLSDLRVAKKLDFAKWGGYAQDKRFSERRIPFENPDSTAAWNAAPSEGLFIPTFSAANGRRFLPASALKGALRTGLIFSRWNTDTIQRLEQSIEADRFPRRATETAESSVSAGQMRLLSIGDSGATSDEGYKVYLMRTASLDTRPGQRPNLVWKIAGRGSVPSGRLQEATPVFAEMASPGTSFEGTWDRRSFIENIEVARALGWKTSPTVQSIMSAANEYASAQLDRQDQYVGMSGLSALADGLQRIRDEVKNTSSASLSCVLCLGWGAGYLSKAGYLDTSQEGFRRILKTVPAISRGVRDGVVYPKTRRILFLGQNALSLPGWTRLDLEI